MRPRYLETVVAAAAVLSLTLAACTAAPTPSSPSTGTPSSAPPTASSAPATTASGALPTGTPADVVTGLEAPWSVVFLGDTPLISQRDDGTVLEVTGDQTRPIGTVEGVQHGGESGLLGLAVDDQDRLYAYSTGSDGNRIQRFEVIGEPGSLALGEAETIIDGLPSATIHDGGRIAFGPDGMLYATVGDAGQTDDAQDLDSLAGKILRMTPDGDVPDDNPFDGSFVYSYGHRNPQGIAWADDGTLFAAEFGQNTWDELNIITPGGNYGWPRVEGIAGQEDFIDPVQQWSPDQASPSGIAITGGTIFIANLRGAVLRAVPVADPTTSTDFYAGEYGRLRAVTPGPDGDLWFLTNNTDGRGTPRDGDDRILGVALEE
ncbi:PQQ-dependent sugar dehydrogenase [Promicromonospora iranensis]|uniref:Glucose/arabinose dehydrogenase n=1 Tax=Promicromonospora iranensis TaxID=1105144 RepID=A0ABU2CKF8_9MICO|nr:PQQ-dependent sugar dehydrogenase [Promicromonospora iranensis]MDR7381821.1 glucose/arabinose dehydrogenase [Promicromonospora iranensis]